MYRLIVHSKQHRWLTFCKAEKSMPKNAKCCAKSGSTTLSSSGYEKTSELPQYVPMVSSEVVQNKSSKNN
jgi:hypothetical protein